MAPNYTVWREIGFFVFFITTVCHSVVGISSPLLSFNGSDVHEITPIEHTVHKVNVSVPIIYDGKSFTSFYISNGGFIAFTDSPSQAIYTALDWSAEEVSPFLDIPFIAPYYYDAVRLDTVKNYAGHVFYQELHSSTNQKLLENLGQYVRSQVTGSDTFDPTWGIQVTWENVTSSSLVASTTCSGTSSHPCAMNTFQLILLTDGGQSYAIFNYGRMDIVPQKYTQAGFNGGHGIGWTNLLPGSSSLRRLNELQGSDVKGRYIFRISSGKIFMGGCTTDRSYSHLNIHPNYAGMFGGKLIDVSGPCFTGNVNNIMCRFGDNPGTVQKAIFVSQSRVRCVVPRLQIRDRVKLSLSLNGGNSYPYSTTITIVFPGRSKTNEHLAMKWTNNDLGWYAAESKTLTLEWKPALLSNNSKDRVDVRLVGYREANGVSSYMTLSTLGSGLPVSQGRLTIDPEQFQCSGQDCYNYEVGLVEVQLQKGAIPQQYGFLSSTVIPLGWYVQNAMKNQYGTDWPSKLCVNWYDKDSQNKTWEDALLHCPCSVQQAMSDFGRWQPDHGCNVQNKDSSVNCYFHKEATHCVRAVQPVNGAGNQCCYSDKGVLIFAADTFQGSTPDRSHDWGAAPYGKPGYVPSLSHWVDDVISFYYCCLWDDYKSCDLYMDTRATKDCAGYSPPLLASVYGQGHVTPFGGLSRNYRMFGPGDYVLMTSGDTTIQGRFERNPFETENGDRITSSVVLTAVSVQNKGVSDTVELIMKGRKDNRDFQSIDVMVNGEIITFDRSSLAWQDFTGVAVMNTDVTAPIMSNFTVMLTNDIGFQVVEIANTLQLDLMIPTNTFENISGLLGDLSGNFLLPNGSVVDQSDIDTNTEMYNKYQLAWSVKNKTSSLFQDYIPANHSYLGRVELDPSEMPGVNENSVRATCGNDVKCTWDYRYTGSMHLAAGTHVATKRYVSMSRNLLPIRSCGLLNVPRAKKDNINYVIGTTTTLTECRSGSLSGHSTYTCTATSNTTQAWSPTVTATCEVFTEDAGVGMIIGVVVAVVILVVIAITIAVVLLMKRRKKYQPKKRAGSAKSKDEEETLKTAV